MRKRHKHADIIKAWADGFTIEYYNEVYGYWVSVGKRVMPSWDPDIDYRIKTIEDEPSD